MGLEFFRLRQVDIKRSIDIVTWCGSVAFVVVPLLERNNGTWNGL